MHPKSIMCFTVIDVSYLIGGSSRGASDLNLTQGRGRGTVSS